jgi:hypothetical protein
VGTRDEDDGCEDDQRAEEEAEHRKTSTIGILQPPPTDARQPLLRVLPDVFKMIIGLPFTPEQTMSC